jgi:DNA processing protein
MEETITRDDPRYPLLLKQIHDPPAELHVRGTLPPSDALALAVVGSRSPTPYGQRVVRDLVEPIARLGIVIVSGLAYGIDAAAHEAACRVRGTTVAVLGSGGDDRSLFPAGNRALAKRLIDAGGAVISEFPDGTPPLKHHFPIRNRVIAGIAKGTLVIEAAAKSGSLITARCALENGREVFAVPGSIHSPMSEGPNNLIKMGARPVTSPEDILSVFGHEAGEPVVHHEPGSPSEAAILALLTKEPLHIDDIIRASGLDPSQTSSTLTLMEMKGAARHVGGMFYVRG